MIVLAELEASTPRDLSGTIRGRITPSPWKFPKFRRPFVDPKRVCSEAFSNASGSTFPSWWLEAAVERVGISFSHPLPRRLRPEANAWVGSGSSWGPRFDARRSERPPRPSSGHLAQTVLCRIGARHAQGATPSIVMVMPSVSVMKTSETPSLYCAKPPAVL
jgi:hypothetical protein